MGLFRKKKNSVGENRDFVNLIRVAQEDAGIRTQLLGILSLDEFNRKSALNTWLEDMRLKRAPGQLVSAVNCLLDDDVAKKALEVLSSE
jgi:hypothetical protein